MGGRRDGPSQAELALQNQQLELERQRLDMERNSNEAAETERRLLQQQLEMQSQAQQQQTTILQQQSNAAAQQQQEFSSLLRRQQEEEERTLKLSRVEAVRASVSEAQQLQRANFSLLRNVARGSVARRRSPLMDT